MRFRHKILEILIWFLERELSDIPKQTLNKAAYDGMMSQIWQNPAFRKYIQDRDARLIYTLAGSEGMAPEPRDAYTMHTGQRVELLVFAREAKAAWMRSEKNRVDTLKLEQEMNPASTPV